MQVQDVMTNEVCCCGPATNAAQAAELMWMHNCGSLPIVEDGGRVIGIVTDRDLFIALGTQNRKAADLYISEVMSGKVDACSATDDIDAALRTMAEKRVHRLAVVDDSGKLQGILSIDDIVARAEADAISGAVLQTLKTMISKRPASAVAGAASASEAA